MGCCIPMHNTVAFLFAHNLYSRCYLLFLDPEYKSRFSQLLKDDFSLKVLLTQNKSANEKNISSSSIGKQLLQHLVSPLHHYSQNNNSNNNNNHDTLNYLTRHTSKSYDNNIGSSCADSSILFNISHSNTSSNVSSHSNILDPVQVSSQAPTAGQSSSLVTLTISDANHYAPANNKTNNQAWVMHIYRFKWCQSIINKENIGKQMQINSFKSSWSVLAFKKNWDSFLNLLSHKT